MIVGRPSPRRRQKAPQSGGVKPLRSSRDAARSHAQPALAGEHGERG